MTPAILDRLQSLRRELGATEMTIIVNTRGVEARADGELMFTNMVVAEEPRSCPDSSLLAFGAAILNGEVQP